MIAVTMKFQMLELSSRVCLLEEEDTNKGIVPDITMAPQTLSRDGTTSLKEVPGGAALSQEITYRPVI